ncbi:MAG: TolC family protein [Mariniphaga sp.]
MIKNIFCTVFLVFLIFENSHAQSLDSFINSGLKNSPLLYDFNNQQLSGKLDSLLLLASFKPQINQLTQAVHYPTGSDWGYDAAITNGGNYAALLNITQTLFSKKRINGQLQTIDLLNQTLKLNAKITVLDLKKSISAQYLTAYADFVQYNFNKSILQQLTNEQSTIKALVDKGVYLVTDFMNLQIMIKAQGITCSQSYNQLKNDVSLLNFLCGITGQGEFNLTKPELTLQNNINPESSPVYAQFRIDSLKNINSRQLIDLNYRPKINVFADGGFNSIAPSNIPHNLGVSAGINFTVPIYDGKQRKLQYNKIDLAENTRIYYRRYYSSQYRMQYDQLNNQLVMTDQLLTEIKNQLSDQERLIELYRIELEKGIVRFLDFITVFNNYNATKITFLVTEVNRLQIINQLNYLK